jgi:putative transposase
MPYEFRKLSTEERNAIVEDRRKRGFPFHQPPHPFRGEGNYLITAVNFEHKTIMAEPDRRSAFEKILLSGFQEIGAEIIAWVILPNHYHILVEIETLDLVSSLLKQIHGATSHEWNRQDSLIGKRRVWYRFTDRKIRNDTHLKQSIHYIHYNPVKHGLINDVYDWRWSSLFLYINDERMELENEQWRRFNPPEDFGNGWDD